MGLPIEAGVIYPPAHAMLSPIVVAFSYGIMIYMFKASLSNIHLYISSLLVVWSCLFLRLYNLPRVNNRTH